MGLRYTKGLKRFFFCCRVGSIQSFSALLSNRKEGKLAQKREPNVQKNSRVSPNLEPVKHLSGRLQQKLVKRASRQLKRFRSSGKPYPLAIDTPETEEQRSEFAATSPLTAGQRVAIAIASLVLVVLLTLGLVGIAAATHAANGIVFLILLVVVLFTSAAVIINIMLNRKP
jgi:hypothetical protein